VRLADSITEATAENAEERALVYFLFEHKSQSDPLTVFQLLSYIVRIGEKRLRDGLPFCPIVPLVVYHGESGWTAARSVKDLISAPKGLADYQVNFQFPLLDLSQLSDDELPDWIQAIGVYVMSVNKNIDSQQYKQTLKSVLPTQFEPGSLADRLLIQGREEGREEGKLAGKIQTLRELLGDAVTSDDELLSRDRDTLTTELASLQVRLRSRDA
jgi:hypothetical protein